MKHSERFLADIEEFMKQTRMSDSGFSLASVGDPNFVTDLRKGRKATLKLVDKVYDYMGLFNSVKPSPEKETHD